MSSLFLAPRPWSRFCTKQASTFPPPCHPTPPSGRPTPPPPRPPQLPPQEWRVGARVGIAPTWNAFLIQRHENPGTTTIAQRTAIQSTRVGQSIPLLPAHLLLSRCCTRSPTLPPITPLVPPTSLLQLHRSVVPALAWMRLP